MIVRDAYRDGGRRYDLRDGRIYGIRYRGCGYEPDGT